MRSHRAGRHLCARLPADSGSSPLRHRAAPEQDLAHQHDRALMAGTADTLGAALSSALGDKIKSTTIAFREVTIVVAADQMIETFTALRDHSELGFDMLIDL